MTILIMRYNVSNTLIFIKTKMEILYILHSGSTKVLYNKFVNNIGLKNKRVRESENKSNIFINKYVFIKNIKSVGNKQYLFSFLICIIRHVQNQYFKAKKDFYHHAIKYLSSEINSWVKVDINIFCWKTFLRRLTNNRTSKEKKRVVDDRKRRMTDA